MCGTTGTSCDGWSGLAVGGDGVGMGGRAMSCEEGGWVGAMDDWAIGRRRGICGTADEAGTWARALGCTMGLEVEACMMRTVGAVGK